MDVQGIILVLASAMLHSGWNLLSKSCGSPVSFLYQALKYSMLAYLPLALVMQFYVTYPPLYAVFIAASGIFTGGYFFALAKAYEHGHLSIAYPLARALPVIFIAFGGILSGEKISVCGWCGIILILSGCMILPLKSLRFSRELKPSELFNRSTFWALISALFTAAYSMCDKFGARYAPGTDAFSLAVGKVNYVYFQNAICLALVFISMKLSRTETKNRYHGRALICGLTFLISYSLIMMALATNPVAYVVSFRQLSIVIGAVASMLFIEKEFIKIRLFAVIMIFCGVILVGTG